MQPCVKTNRLNAFVTYCIHRKINETHLQHVRVSKRV